MAAWDRTFIADSIEISLLKDMVTEKGDQDSCLIFIMYNSCILNNVHCYIDAWERPRFPSLKKYCHLSHWCKTFISLHDLTVPM